jgi:hypothetical protein
VAVFRSPASLASLDRAPATMSEPGDAKILAHAEPTNLALRPKYAGKAKFVIDLLL